jgi:hypothetical protein
MRKRTEKSNFQGYKFLKVKPKSPEPLGHTPPDLTKFLQNILQQKAPEIGVSEGFNFNFK